MTRDEIIYMAREANLTDGIEIEREIVAIELFAKLIAAAERKEWKKEFAGMGEWGCVYLLEERGQE